MNSKSNYLDAFGTWLQLANHKPFQSQRQSHAVQASYWPLRQAGAWLLALLPREVFFVLLTA